MNMHASVPHAMKIRTVSSYVSCLVEQALMSEIIY